MTSHPTSGLRDFRTSGRQAFTLIEILVSLMIFTVVSGAMLSMLFMATDLYRRTEAGRAATDEAVTVLASLDADLQRMTPRRDDGWITAEVLGDNGRMAVAWLARHEDPARRRVDSGRIVDDRQIVVWWLDGNDNLKRATLEEPAPVAGTTVAERCSQALVAFGLAGGSIVTHDCLHFSAMLSLPGDPRDAAGHWMRTIGGNTLEPRDDGGGTLLYDTSLGVEFPESVCFRLGLTGGTRFASKGFLIDVSGDRMRYANVKTVPSLPGSLARIGRTEWVGYRLVAPGILDVASDASDPRLGRARLNSLSPGTEHGRGAAVEFAQFHTLVRGLPW